MCWERFSRPPDRARRASATLSFSCEENKGIDKASVFCNSNGDQKSRQAGWRLPIEIAPGPAVREEMNKQNRNVAIVGAGLIGRAWAAIFARAGWNVRLTDPHQPTLNGAIGLIRDELHALARHGLADDPEGAVARLSVASSLEAAVDGVEFVQENGPE